MATVKKLGIFVVCGSLFGVVVASLLAPGMLGWYNAPASGGAMCNCADIVRSTADALIKAQLIGGAAGAVMFLIVGILFVRWQKERAARKLAEAAAATKQLEQPAPQPPQGPPSTSA